MDDCSLRLVDRLSIPLHNGLVQIKLSGEWKVICGDMNAAAAKVVCRYLRLPTYVSKLLVY